jgi:hypothetical protein
MQFSLIIVLTAFVLHVISQPQVAFNLAVQVEYNLSIGEQSPLVGGDGGGRVWAVPHATQTAGWCRAFLLGPLTQPLLTHVTSQNILTDKNSQR